MSNPPNIKIVTLNTFERLSELVSKGKVTSKYKFFFVAVSLQVLIYFSTLKEVARSQIIQV